MFSESLVESTPLLRTRSRLPALVSLAVQGALVAVIIAIPLLHPEVLPTASRKLSTLDPPPNPVPPPPVPRPQVVTATSVPAPTAPSTPSYATTAMRPLIDLTGAKADEPVLAIGNMIGPANPALPAGLVPASPHVTISPVPKPSNILNISSGVTAGLLLAPIRPDYPIIARTTATQGTVVIRAIISREGRIESAHVLSGPALLQSAALDAVRSARYHPYLLNGQPTEVETTISIIFHLGS